MVTLVTGGAGYIGSHVVLALLDRGEDVIVLDNLSTGFRDAVPPPAKLVIGDVGDKPLVGELIRTHRVRTIIHLAASTVVPDSVRAPLAYYENNTVNSRTLIEAAAEEGIEHFVFSSTAAVYGAGSGKPLKETMTPRPISPYGMSKLMTERMLIDAAAAGGPHYAILRYFNVAGADPRGRAGQSTLRATHLIKAACQAILSRDRTIQVFGIDYDTPDGTCVRDYIHVSDLASAHLAALQHLKQKGAPCILNCGYGHGASVLEVLRTVEDAAGRKFNIRYAARRPGDAPSVIASNDKIRKTLSWKPALDDLKVIVGHALAWEERLLKREAA